MAIYCNEVEYVISCVEQAINTAPSRKISITPVKTGRKMSLKISLSFLLVLLFVITGNSPCL